MSTKLNAQEYEYRTSASFFVDGKVQVRKPNGDPAIGLLDPDVADSVCRAVNTAIREVAQPIADQRDELLEALSNEVDRMANLIRAIDMLKDSPVSLHRVLMNGVGEARQRLTNYRAILAKYTKP
jgi:hypothetical protein